MADKIWRRAGRGTGAVAALPGGAGGWRTQWAEVWMSGIASRAGAQRGLGWRRDGGRRVEDPDNDGQDRSRDFHAGAGRDGGRVEERGHGPFVCPQRT